MTVATIDGIEARTVTTGRLSTRVLFAGPEDGVPVLFVHGNFSSATWWEETMVAMPPGFRAIAPDQRGFGDADPAVKVDATRGMQDFVDDALALMDHLGHERFHLVGNSLGGLVCWWAMAAAPERLLSVTLAGPGAPWGFGGTRDERGTPTNDDFAGSGGGLIRPDLVQAILDGDRGTTELTSPRAVLRLLVWGPPDIPAREEELLDAMFHVHIGDRDLPGDKVESPNWPFVSPGRWGATNAMSPRYVGDLVERMLRAGPKPDVLWIYGANDAAVSNSAASDPGTWGPLDRVPGYPGKDRYPPQPMMKQIRYFLEEYARQGGQFAEAAVPDAGHVPFITHPEQFNPIFHHFLLRRKT